MSELYGRQVLFFGTYAALTAFNAGAAGSTNIQTLLILRFFAGAFGSSPLTNAGGVIADMFPASQRGLAMSVFAAAPFLGPTLGEYKVPSVFITTKAYNDTRANHWRISR
jgi:MFS family permease